MTNNEAIGILAIVVETAKGRCFVTDEAISDAYAMAISALQAQEAKAQLSAEGTTSDLISRQDAIDALMDFDKKLRKINWYQYPHTEYECRGVDEAIVKIENVPSAQPEPLVKESRPLVKDLVKDTISRQAVIDRINKQREHLQPDIYPQDKIGDAAYRICAEFIERLPSAQPEPQWIPVSERLPEEKEFVLVTFGWFGRKTDPEVNIDEMRDGDWMISEVVTAWMPLPEPYREERRTDE